MFPNAVTIPGFLHILHNAEQDLHQAMPLWKVYFAQAKQVLKLFSSGHGHNRKFIANCVVNTRWAPLKPQLEVVIPKVLESRWSSLLRALRLLVPLEYPLTRAWSLERFQQGNDDDDAGGAANGDAAEPDDEHKLQPRMVDSCVRSAAFWTMTAALLHLQEALEAFREWCEGRRAMKH